MVRVIGRFEKLRVQEIGIPLFMVTWHHNGLKTRAVAEERESEIEIKT